MRVLLVPNTNKPHALAASREAAGFLVARGHEPVLVADDAIAAGLESHGVPLPDVMAVDLVVGFGGDGTILKAVDLLGDGEAPVLGMNLGRLGFLSAVREDRLIGTLDAAVAGRLPVERRQTLDVRVESGADPQDRLRALNDVVVGRSSSRRSVELEVQVNDVTLFQCVCDGVIVATATGSTAYSLSAGGPLLAPDVRGMVVLPVAPHTLRARAVVVGPTDRVRVAPVATTDPEIGALVDGVAIEHEGVFDSVTVSLGERDVRLLRADDYDFYASLARTFFGA